MATTQSTLTEEAIIRSNWPKLPEWNPNWLDKHINNIKRYTMTFNKAKNEYNQESPEYVEGVLVVALHHLVWLLPVMIALFLAHWSRYCYKPCGNLCRTLRSCICLCVTAILIVAAIQVFLYTLLARLPPFFTMHPEDNDEIRNFMNKLDPKIIELKDKLQAAYTGDMMNISSSDLMDVINPIDRIVYAGENLTRMYRDPNYTMPIVSALTKKLLENSWYHFKLFQGMWILALICIFIAAILQPYLAGAFCAILWCGIGAMSVTWVAVQLADACMLPSRAIKSLPYDWTYKEMYSILKEYERVCEEFEAQFSAKLGFYRNRYEEAIVAIRKVNRSGWGNTRQRKAFANAMYERVERASNELMENDLQLKCKYNSSTENNRFPKTLPPYEKVIRWVCHGARKLQLLLLQALILTLAPIICFFILVYATITMKASSCPSAPCPSQQKPCGTGSCTSITSCGPCALPSNTNCSFRNPCGGTHPCSNIDTCPGPLPKKLGLCTNYMFDQKARGIASGSVCNAVNMNCNIPCNTPCNVPCPPTRCTSNPLTCVPSTKICSGVGPNLCPALMEYARLNCEREDKACDTIRRCEQIMVYRPKLHCSTSFSHTRLRLYPALTTGSKFDVSSTRYLETKATSCPSPIVRSLQEIRHVRCSESKSTIVPSPISGSNHLIYSANVSDSNTFIPALSKSRQETSVQSDGENKNILTSSISEFECSVSPEKSNDGEISKVISFSNTQLNDEEVTVCKKVNCSTVTSPCSICTDEITENSNSSSRYLIPPTASEQTVDSSWLTERKTLNSDEVSSATMFQPSESNKMISKSKSGLFSFNLKSDVSNTTQILEYNREVFPSSTTVLTDCNASDYSAACDDRLVTIKESSTMLLQQTKSEPTLESRCSKRQTKLVDFPKPIFCTQCRTRLQTALDSEEYLYFPTRNTACDPISTNSVDIKYNQRIVTVIDQKCSDAKPVIHQPEHRVISQPIPTLILRDSESKSSPPSMSDVSYSPTNINKVKLKPAIKLTPRMPRESERSGTESGSQHSICSGCKSNVDFGSKVHLCVAPRTSSKVRLCLTPAAPAPVIPQGLYGQFLCGNPKCTRGDKCVCKNKIGQAAMFKPSSGKPNKSILIKVNNERRKLAPYQIVRLPSAAEGRPLPRPILKNSPTRMSTSSREGND